jgi:hypothetical protein
MKKRETLGLPPLPKGDAENVRKILKGIKVIDRFQKPVEENADVGQ